MATMRAARIHSFGGPEVLEIDQVPTPEPAADEVLVRVHAASVNPIDYKLRSGRVMPASLASFPMAVGRDISGVVERTGSQVTAFRPGDAVYATVGRVDRGAFADFVAVRADGCAIKPRSLDHRRAAAVPLAGLTAWQGLFDHGVLSAGQRVLIHGGAGGVGHLAVQFAKVRGAWVCTTVSAEDLAFVNDLGADQAIDYQVARFEDQVRDMDLVFDLVGGDTRDRSWSVLKRGGMLVSTVGSPSPDDARRHGVRATGYVSHPDGAQLAEIARLIDERRVRPFVQAAYTLGEVRRAEERAEHEHTRGKLVIDLLA